MPQRPTLTDRLVCLAADWHARRVYSAFRAATRRATAIQERTLLSKIRRNAASDFGRRFGFDAIRSADDFVRRVPVLGYEDHQPYIERVKAGETSALFGRAERIHMFALTSGTTDSPKYIPVTESFLREYRAGWNAFGIKALLDHPGTMLRPILQVTSRMDESKTTAGIPCGAITGLMAATQKRLVRKYYVTPPCIARIDDASAKYYTVMRLGVAADVAFMITASPATQLKLARTADRHREQIIRDVRDGTLWDGIEIPSDVRAELRPRLRPDPQTAGRLETLISEHGRLLPKHYWRLGFLANWIGGTMGLYLRDFPEYFGKVPVRDIGLLASEGRVCIPIEDGSPAGILDVTSHFFEFVPRDEIEAASPTALRCHQLEVGQEYFILLTTSSGLCRYNLGDLVRVVDYADEAPVVEFLSKGAHTCSLAGEKLTEHQVVLAMQATAQILALPVAPFVLAPIWDSPPAYRLHIESSVAGDRRGMNGAGVAAEFDRQLQIVNMEYASRRRSERLGAIRVNLLPAGFFAQWDQQRAEQHRRGNEQYKHPYLFASPGEDADFPKDAATHLSPSC